MSIPVIDLFAGPGGLGEGFSSLYNNNAFEVVLSIEKDQKAWQTLLLRSFFRQYPKGEAPESYYKFIRQKGYVDVKKLAELIEGDTEAERKFQKAREIAWNAELGKNGNVSDTEIDERINRALTNENGEKKETWILIGGPPCQAYSVVGRSRNRGIDPNDPKVRLYREYLRILAVHNPPVFVMENVTGILSAQVEESPIFEKILTDIKDPGEAYAKLNGKRLATSDIPGYDIYSFVKEPRNKEREETEGPEFNHKDFIIRSEYYGIPQARHRVILLGIRKDFKWVSPRILEREKSIHVSEIITGLPAIRSGLSKRKDSARNWRRELLRLKLDVLKDVDISIIEDPFELDDRKEILKLKSFRDWIARALALRTYYILDSVEAKYPDKAKKMNEVLNKILNSKLESRGAEYLDSTCDIGTDDDELRSWYIDNRIDGVCNHTARGHMSSDLYRYLFIALFGEEEKRSPKLVDFPRDLLPNHQNVNEGVNDAKFADRFRVQLWNKPAKTITSHISKDGHYFIHPDPEQCRSLTVREAARIQTFPDNYFFCGPRTSQYVQVGNAVPPLLAKKLAKIVRELFRDINHAKSSREVKAEV